MNDTLVLLIKAGVAMIVSAAIVGFFPRWISIIIAALFSVGYALLKAGVI